MKSAFREYLSFSRRDRIGVVGLAGLILLVYFLPLLFTADEQPLPLQAGSPVLLNTDDTTEENVKASRFPTRTEGYREWAGNKNAFKGAAFTFDPNILNVEGWKRLGLRDKTIKTIGNYLAKGGRFYKAEDLQKIWGLPAGFFDRVKDYISIAPVLGAPENRFTSGGPGKPAAIMITDINTADSLAFVALPGIGNKLASRIINFRQKLGGFYSTDQVGEVYGLQDSVFQKIRQYLQIGGAVRKININSASKDELRAHPYIRWNLANAIVEYRNQHGDFKSLEALRNISIIDEAAYNKIIHYLTADTTDF